MSLSEPNDTRPLYAKVRAKLLERIRSGAWKPGQLIPNEFDIAAEFGVSQGTARKAISELASEGLVVRHQGRGTFVVEHTPAHVLFRFFNLFDPSGAAVIPDSRNTRSTVAASDAAQRQRLALEENALVIRIARIRTRGGIPFITETITLPEALFPGLTQRSELPNTLYDMFQKSYGVLVMRTDDRLSAATADAETALTLSVDVGTPLLRIDRIAFGLDDKPIEWRVSLCNLGGAHYLARNG
jgi:GntR family transcriptional regulator